MTLLTVILTIGATARITRFITHDKITEKPRDWVLDHLNPHGLLTYMTTCPWCISIYTATITTATSYWWANSPYWLIPATALTASHATGLLAGRED